MSILSKDDNGNTIQSMGFAKTLATSTEIPVGNYDLFEMEADAVVVVTFDDATTETITANELRHYTSVAGVASINITSGVVRGI